jgi:hypothetical protein
MRKWSDTIDPATIPDEVIISERGRRNSLKRKTYGGGRPPVIRQCPWCAQSLSARELRNHERACTKPHLSHTSATP